MDENIQMIYDTADEAGATVSKEQNIINQMEIILHDQHMKPEVKVHILAQ